MLKVMKKTALYDYILGPERLDICLIPNMLETLLGMILSFFIE